MFHVKHSCEPFPENAGPAAAPAQIRPSLLKTVGESTKDGTIRDRSLYLDNSASSGFSPARIKSTPYTSSRRARDLQPSFSHGAGCHTAGFKISGLSKGRSPPPQMRHGGLSSSLLRHEGLNLQPLLRKLAVGAQKKAFVLFLQASQPRPGYGRMKFRQTCFT